MAFGSWFKKLKDKVINGVKKALPVVRKIIDGVQRIAPIASTVIGSNAGKLIGQVGKIADGADRAWNAVANRPTVKSAVTADRFAVPMLK